MSYIDLGDQQVSNVRYPRAFLFIGGAQIPVLTATVTGRLRVMPIRSRRLWRSTRQRSWVSTTRNGPIGILIRMSQS